MPSFLYFSQLLQKYKPQQPAYLLIYRNQAMGLNQLNKEALIAEVERLSVELDKARQSSKAYFNDIFNNSNDLVQLFSVQGELFFVNKVWKERLGYTDEQLRQLRLQHIVHPDHYQAFRDEMQRVAGGQPPMRFETAFRAASGQDIYLSGSIHCTVEHGQVIECRGIFIDITGRIRAEKAQGLYYNIAHLAIQPTDLDKLYQGIHQELGNLIPVKNFYIALQGSSEEHIYFPYYIDENYDNAQPIPERTRGQGLTEYAIDQKRPLILYKHDILALEQTGKITIHGKVPAVWLCAPLMAEQRTIGVIAVQHYHKANAFTHKDLELLHFISGQIAVAIERRIRDRKITSQTGRLDAIFQNSNLLIWTVDRHFRFTFFNHKFSAATKQYYGIVPEEGSGFRQVEKKGGSQKFIEFWTRNYREALKGRYLRMEISFRDRKLPPLWKDVHITPITNKEGQVTEISCIAHDVTENKISAKALQESEEKFRNIFESFQDIYFRCSMQGKLTLLSPSVNELVGFAPEQIINKNITDYYLYNSKTKDLLKQLIRHKTVRNFEASIITRNGSIINCICNVRLIYNNKGKPFEIEGVARDFTQLKKANQALIKSKEVAERSLKVKERFLANMSHEIRTPMNGIIGVIDLIADTELTEEQYGYVKTIRKSSETLLAILNDILDLSKIEAGKMRLRRQPIRVAGTLEKLYALFSQRANAKGTSLEYSIDLAVPQVLMIDETRLLQVLSNLTSNAIKFTGRGGKVAIAMSLDGQQGKKHIIKVAVNDSGIGISDKDQALLFNSFSQVDSSMTKSYGGTGLGLSISKELTRMMGGDIGVTSKPGVGSTFWFTFGAEASDAAVYEDTPVDDETFVLTDHFAGHAPEVLLVDDNAINRQVAGQLLTKSGCRVTLAESGAEAIDKVQHNRYDLIFMDIQMPEMDGVTATRLIKELKGVHVPPITAMTAYSMREDREKFLSQGFDDYVPKPIKAYMLIEKVKAWLNDQPSTPVKEEVPAAEPATEAVAVINNTVINQLKQYGGLEMVEAALKDFEVETTAFFNELATAMSREDYQKILSILHTIKGNAGTLGIDKMANTAREVEAGLKNKETQHLPSGIQELHLNFEEFKAHTQQLLKVN